MKWKECNWYFGPILCACPFPHSHLICSQFYVHFCVSCDRWPKEGKKVFSMADEILLKMKRYKGLNQFDFWGVVPIQFHVDYEEDCLAHSIPVKGPKSGENGLVEIEIKSNDWEEHENWGAKNNFYYCISKVRNLFLLLVDLLEGYFLSFY